MKRIIAIAILGLLFVGCKKNENNQGGSGLDFTSVRKYDVDAQYLGNIGNATDDYTMEDWPSWVVDLFKPMDTANISGYVMNQVSIDALYPNPCADSQVMRVFATEPVNLKVVIIDQFKTVYYTQSMNVYAGIHKIGFNYKNLHMPATNFRMYYAFSAADKPFYYRGHIDILKTQ